MQKIVVDTNVVISSNLSSSSHPAAIMKQFYNSVLQLFYTSEILAEYKSVLAYKKFNFTKETQAAILRAIEIGGVHVAPPTSTILFNDESDRIFYDTAKFSNAILITGNMKHYPASPFIMTPADFVSKTKPRPVFGSGKGKMWIADDFDASPDELEEYSH